MSNPAFRKVRGNIPRDGIEMTHVYDDWVLYYRPGHGDDGWESYKLVWLGRGGVRKANYWFGWNGERLARNNDERRLKIEAPKLYYALVSTLKRYRFGHVGESAA